MTSHDIVTEGLRSFFETLTTTSPDRLAAMYAPTILVAGPHAALTIPRDALLGKVSERKRLLDSVGPHTTTLRACEETALSERYILARTIWQWDFEASAESVIVPSTFIVDNSGDSPQIILYLLRTDVVSVLRERGLLPPAA